MPWMGLWSAHASTFLTVLVIGTTLLFALPLLFFPIGWARLFGWRIPERTDLAIYFGRCLGAFILVFEVLAWRAARGHDAPLVFAMLLGISGLMTLVHAWGAYRRIQPPLETLETFFYAALFVLGWLFFPVG
jgi:hypothetical protein